mmetsp:Transcript_15041/g.22862  ORF Transcript_15041/g.22862 Transcript_15041/m.22862 type:complete len:218 (+) Transcript_15041:210-863(+)
MQCSHVMHHLLVLEKGQESAVRWKHRKLLLPFCQGSRMDLPLLVGKSCIKLHQDSNPAGLKTIPSSIPRHHSRHHSRRGEGHACLVHEAGEGHAYHGAGEDRASPYQGHGEEGHVVVGHTCPCRVHGQVGHGGVGHALQDLSCPCHCHSSSRGGPCAGLCLCHSQLHQQSHPCEFSCSKEGNLCARLRWGKPSRASQTAWDALSAYEGRYAGLVGGG